MINIEQYLDTHDFLVYSNKGVSMLPMLKQGPSDLRTVMCFTAL